MKGFVLQKNTKLRVVSRWVLGLAFAVMLLGDGLGRGAEIREWTDSTGSFSRRASFYKVHDGLALLRTPSGRIIRVPLAKLSKADIDYIERVRSGGDPPESRETVDEAAENPPPKVPDATEAQQAGAPADEMFRPPETSKPQGPEDTESKGFDLPSPDLPELDGAPKAPLTTITITKDPPCRGLALSPKGDIVAVLASDSSTAQTVVFFAASSGRRLGATPPQRIRASLLAAHFSPDGRMLATFNGFEKPIRIWDPRTAKELATIEYKGSAPSACVFSPDCRYLLFASGDDAVLWDLKAGKPRHIIRGHEEYSQVTAVAFHPNGKTFVTAGGDGDRKIIFWDTESGNQLNAWEEDAGTKYCLTFSRDGRYLAVGPRFLVWDVDKKEIAFRPRAQHEGRVAFAFGDEYVLQKAGVVTFFKMGEPEKLNFQDVLNAKSGEFPDNERKIVQCWDAAFGLNNSTMAVNVGHAMAIWDGPDKLLTLIPIKGYGGRRFIACSDDGLRVAFMTSDTEVVVANIVPLRQQRAETETREAEAKRLAQADAVEEQLRADRAVAEKAAKKAETDRLAAAKLQQSKPLWDGFEDFDRIVADFGRHDGLDGDTPARRFVLFGTPENAKKAAQGDRFDREEAIEAAAKHKHSLSERTFFIQRPYEWAERGDTDTAVALLARLPFRAMIPVGLRPSLSSYDIDDLGNAVLMADGRLRPCTVNEANELIRLGKEVYLKEDILKSRLLLWVGGSRELQKQVARNASRHVLNIGFRGLKAIPPGQEGWFRREGLTTTRWDCQALRANRVRNLNGPNDHPNYFVTAEREDLDDPRFPVAVFADIVRVEIVRSTPEERTVLFSLGADE